MVEAGVSVCPKATGAAATDHPTRKARNLERTFISNFESLACAPRFDEEGKKIENGRFVKVVHNGKVIHENVEVTGPTRAAAFENEAAKGPLMLQGDHGPVAFRNIWIEPMEIK